MNQPAKQSNLQPSFEDSADNYQLRLLTLETHLHTLSQERLLSRKKFESRQHQLNYLTIKLADIRASWSAQASINAHDPIFPMPLPQSCSAEELRICEAHLCEKTTTLRKVAHDTANILKWVTITLAGSNFSLRTNFYLSGLRAKIAFIEGKIRDAEGAKKSERGFVNELEKEELPVSTFKRPALEILKAAFEIFGQRSRRILALKKELQEESERTAWMGRWLDLQEMKMTSYLPSTQLPDPKHIRALSTSVLQENSDVFQTKSERKSQSSMTHPHHGESKWT